MWQRQPVYLCYPGHFFWPEDQENLPRRPHLYSTIARIAARPHAARAPMTAPAMAPEDVPLLLVLVLLLLLFVVLTPLAFLSDACPSPGGAWLGSATPAMCDGGGGPAGARSGPAVSTTTPTSLPGADAFAEMPAGGLPMAETLVGAAVEGKMPAGAPGVTAAASLEGAGSGAIPREPTAAAGAERESLKSAALAGPEAAANVGGVLTCSGAGVGSSAGTVAP